MTKENKQLLLVDLCARLPYNVIVHRTYIWGGELKEDDGLLEIEDLDAYMNNPIEKLNIQGCTLKPYLRPMSSMTKEEKALYEGLMIGVDNVSYMLDVIDWLNVHHFDYRGLIEKGLALKAPEKMYKTELL